MGLVMVGLDLWTSPAPCSITSQGANRVVPNVRDAGQSKDGEIGDNGAMSQACDTRVWAITDDWRCCCNLQALLAGRSERMM
jgi:hypothetical protein